MTHCKIAPGAWIVRRQRVFAALLLAAAHAGCFLGTQIGVQSVLTQNKGTKKAIAAPDTNNPPLVTIGTITATRTQGEGVLQGDISINYTVFDNEADPVTLVVEYSVDGQVTFSAATNAATLTQAPVTDLVTSASGKAYQFVWGSSKDLPSTREENVVVRFTPSDAKAGQARESLPIQVDNNDPPVATVTTPPGSPIGPSVILGWAPVAGAKSYNVYRSATPGIVAGGAPLVGVNAPRTSAADTTATLGTNYYYAVTTVGESGTESALSAEIGPIAPARPGDAAVIKEQTGVPGAGAPATLKAHAGSGILLHYRFTDPNSDTLVASVQYSTDGGLTYSDARSAAAALPGIEEKTELASSASGVDHAFLWDVVADAGATRLETVKLRVTPKDVKTGESGETDAFAIRFNTAPQVQALTLPAAESDAGPPPTVRAGGDVALSFLLLDSNADPCELELSYSLDGVNFLSATASFSTPTKNLASSSTGVQTVVKWDSVANLKRGIFSDVVLRLSAGDAFVTGSAVTFPASPGTDPKLVIDNNDAPSVRFSAGFPPPGDLSGKINVLYELLDSHSDPASVTIRYSVAGATPVDCTQENPIAVSAGRGDLATSVSGVQTVFVWDSAKDLSADRFENVTLVIVPTDQSDGKVGDAVESVPFTVNNTTAPKVTVATPSGVQNGVVSVTYTLSDAEANFCSMSVECEIVGSGVTTPAHRGNGGSPLANLLSNSTGIDHVFAWNSFQVGFDAQKTVRLHFTPRDTLSGLIVTTPPFIVDNQSYGTIAGAPILFPAGSGAGTSLSAGTISVSQGLVTVPFTIFDTAALNSDLAAEFSVDGGLNFAGATSGAGSVWDSSNPQPLATTSTFGGAVNHSFVWNAATDLQSQSLTYTAQALVRFRAVDTGGGTASFPATTGLFTVDNNQAPAVTFNTTLDGQTFTGVTAISYATTDAERDTAKVTFEYTSDGATWKRAGAESGSAPTAGLTTEPAGQTTSASTHEFRWDTKADLGPARLATVQLRASPRDFVKAGGTVTSGQFVVDNNTAPTLTLQHPTGIQRDNVFITYELKDSASDAIALVAEFGAPDGLGGMIWSAATEKAIAASDGLNALSSSPGGTVHNFVWDTRADLFAKTDTGQPLLDSQGKRIPTVTLNARFRLSPSDALLTGQTVTTDPFTVDNTSAPSLSVTTPQGIQASGIAVINYVLTDPESNPVNLGVDFSTDGGLTYQRASPGLTGDGIVALSSSPSGVPHVYHWNTQDVAARLFTEVRLRLTPSDSRKGISQETGNFSVDNRSLTNLNAPPRIQMQPLVGPLAGDITVTYDLIDGVGAGGSNPLVDLVVEYRGGSVGHVWTKAAVSGKTTSVLPGGSKTLIWQSRQGVSPDAGQEGSDADDFEVRITPIIPSDNNRKGARGVAGPFTVDNRAPQVAVLAPNGGEILNGNAVAAISWTSIERHPGSVTVKVDTGTEMNTLIASEPDDGATTFDLSSVAGIEGANYRLVVVATDALGNSAQDSSDAVFIVDKTRPTVTLQAPVGGEKLAGGTGSTQIRWTTTDANPGTVKIEYSSDNFADPAKTKTVTSGVPDNGSFNWAPVAAIDSAVVRIRVTPTDKAGLTAATSAVSPANFTIDTQPPTITLLSPNGGEVLGITTGAAYPIRWRTTDLTPKTVKIEYSTDNFASVGAVIAAAAPDTPGGDGQYSWSLSGLSASSTVRIRVTPVDDLGHTGISDQSDAPFTLTPVSVTRVVAIGPSTSDTPGAPTISTSGGTPLLVFGQGFSTSLTATLGGAAVEEVVRHSSTTVCLLSPAGGAGAATLVITNTTDNSSASLAAAVTYAAPVSPGAGSGFTDSAALSNAQTSNAPAWCDYDRDGDLDLYVAGAGTDALWINQGGGSFVAATFGTVFRDSAGAAMIDASEGLCATWGDVNGDGLDDLFVGNTEDTDFLFINQGGSPVTFKEEGAAWGLLNSALSNLSVSAVFLDYDKDGDADLFVANEDAADPCLLYRNLGSSFSESGAQAGVMQAFAASGVGVADFNVDGYLDIYVAGDGQDLLYFGQSGGTFVESAAISGMGGDSLSGRGVAIGDYNNDGALDIFVANSGSEMPWLWKNLGAGVFSDDAGARMTAVAAGVRRRALWIDLDNDQDLDLVVTCDGADECWINAGAAGGYTLANTPATINNLATATGRGLAAADADDDGDLDLFIGDTGAANDHFLRSGGASSRNFLVIAPVSDRDNQALDAALTEDFTPNLALVEVDLDGDGDFGTGTVLKRLPQSGSGGSQPGAVFVGLGSVTSVGVRVTFTDGKAVTLPLAATVQGGASVRVTANQRIFVRSR